MPAILLQRKNIAMQYLTIQDSRGDEHAHCMRKGSVCAWSVFYFVFFVGFSTQSSRSQFCVSFEVTVEVNIGQSFLNTPPPPLTTSNLFAASLVYSSHLVQYISDMFRDSCTGGVFFLPSCCRHEAAGLIVHRGAQSCRSMRSLVVTPDSDLPPMLTRNTR